MDRFSQSEYDDDEPVIAETPLKFLMWAARTYVWHAARDCDVPDALRTTFSLAGADHAYEAMERAFDRLLASAPPEIILHAPGCPASSEIEQAFILGIRCLQRDDNYGYIATISAIAPPAVVRMVRRDMEAIASMLTDAERSWHAEHERWQATSKKGGATISRLRH